MIFVTLSLVLKNFSLGQLGMLKFNVLLLVLPSLYIHVTVNHLKLKYICRSAMAEWLTHLTTDVGGTRLGSIRIPVINFPPLDVNVCLGVFLACYSQRFEDKRTTRNSQLHCLHYVNNQSIYTHAGVQNYHKLRWIL